MNKLDNDQGKESASPGGHGSYSTPEIESSSLQKKGSQPEPILSDEPTTVDPVGSDASRRTFMKKGLKGAALLPYVTPLIETIFLDDVHAQTNGAPSPIGNTPPPPVDPPPTVTSCNPDNGNQNQSMVVAVSGTDFVDEPTADFGLKINVNGVTFVSSILLHVNIKINKQASSGDRDVTITNPDTQSDVLVNGFTVN